MSGPTPEWAIATNYRDMTDYDIAEAPTNVDDDGNEFITASNPWNVTR